MKITSIDIFKAIVESPTPGWFPICVRVNTDEGICGWGESGIPVMSGRDATMTMISEIAPFILGMDPLDHEVIWQKLYNGSYWAYGGGPIPFAAISALDIALWDIKGKATNLPVYKLLGGKVEALAGVMNYLKGIRQDYVLLSDSDLVINLPLEDVLRRHIDSGADMTALCTTVPGDVSDTYFTVNDTGRITDTVYDVFAPMGCRCLNMFVLSKELLLQMVTECASRNQFSFHRNILREMGKRYHFHAYVYDGYAARINSVQSYYQRSMELLDPAQRAALFCPERPVYAKENDAPPTYIDPTGQCVNSLIADGCDIQGSVRNCILFRGVRVEKDAVVENCILFKGTVVRRGAVLRHVIADKYVRVGEGVHLAGHADYPMVLAREAVLEDTARG